MKRLKSTGRYKLDQTFNKTESIFLYLTDSTFEIHGTDDEETVHGLTQDAAWLNEPYKISRDTFDQIDQRTSDFVVIDYNPKNPTHWVEDIKKDPRAIVIHSTFKDNPFCPIEQRRKILSYQPVKLTDAVTTGFLSESEAQKYDAVSNVKQLSERQLKELIRCQENEYKKSANEFKWVVYGLGEKAERPNRIFNWNEISYSEYLQINAPVIYGVDWGAVDPFGIVEAKYYDGKLYVNELNYSSENELKEKLSITERAQINKEIDEGFVMWFFNKLGIDKTRPIVCDNNRPAKIIALRNAGFDKAVATEKYPGSVIDGIDLLNNIDVYYTSNSVNLKYEQENYSRQVDRYGVVQEEPEDKDNHNIDPIRYIALLLKKHGIIRTL